MKYYRLQNGKECDLTRSNYCKKIFKYDKHVLSAAY